MYLNRSYPILEYPSSLSALDVTLELAEASNLEPQGPPISYLLDPEL
jgi:hypothetical protein